MGKHRLLVIGVGSIGERHLRCFLNTDRVEAEFVEVNPTLRETIAERYPAAKPQASLEAALAAKFDLAVIATPAQLHIPMAQRLAAAGVPSSCEHAAASVASAVNGRTREILMM